MFMDVERMPVEVFRLRDVAALVLAATFFESGC